MTERHTPAERDFASVPKDRAAPFFAFLAVAVVMAMGVLAFLAFEEGRPRAERIAENLAAAPTAPATNPQPAPIPVPTPPR